MMRKECDEIKNIGDFLREQGFKATMIIPKEKPSKTGKPLELSELTQRDH